MHAHEPLTPVWTARLSLDFERRLETTVLARREHFGPLRIQKALYPEGPGICHAIVLHPPAGIVGGDDLSITVQLGPNAHALLTTPGAGKWYRSAGAWATQRLSFHLAEGSCLEWLPQETIVYNGARAEMQTEVDLASNATFFGQEVLCLGRRAADETFDQGLLKMLSNIRLNQVPLWHERGRLDGSSPLLYAATGLAGFSTCGTLLVAGQKISTELLAACREFIPLEHGAQFAITALPELLVARYLGHSSESARAWFGELWHVLRPVLKGVQAVRPRIWNT